MSDQNGRDEAVRRARDAYADRQQARQTTNRLTAEWRDLLADARDRRVTAAELAEACGVSVSFINQELNKRKGSQ